MHQPLNPPVSVRNAAKPLITALPQTGSGATQIKSSFRGARRLRANPKSGGVDRDFRVRQKTRAPEWRKQISFHAVSAPGSLVRLAQQRHSRMLYAILCYHDEDLVGSWSKEHDAAVMQKLAVVQDKLAQQGRLGPVARLLPTTAATTLRHDEPAL